MPYTIAHRKHDGLIETDNVYEKKETAELAATWRSKKTSQHWYALELTEMPSPGCDGFEGF